MNRFFTTNQFLVCLTILIGSCCLNQPLLGQAAFRQALEQLDTNQNGEIEPDEITPLARPYLERIARELRFSLRRPVGINELQEAARVYHALRNGVSGRDVRPEGQSTVKAFGADGDQPLVPEFGLAEIKFPYTQADMDEADQTIRRYDKNRDGYVDRAEAAVSRWTHRSPFEMDLNKDDRLSRMELGQRYARRRLLDNASEELRQKSRRLESQRGDSGRNEERRQDESQWRRGSSRYWLTASMLARFDSNRNGRLESNEAKKLGIPLGHIDVNRDGELSRDELHEHLMELQEAAGDLAEGLPAWFFELDKNRDQQVSMSEFTTEWTDEKVQEFRSMDSNEDGVLTSSEVAGSTAVAGGSYVSQKAQVLSPRKTIISEIEVNDDYLIRDLNVQISITHSSVSRLDGYLTGPDGQRIELFTEIGGSDDHFDQTIFDDQSRVPITKARPPFKGAFIPEGMLKKQPSLSHFNGKSVKGVWQLVIRGTRNERFGMLHDWRLIVKPQEKDVDDRPTVVEQEKRRIDEKQRSSSEKDLNPNRDKEKNVDREALFRKVETEILEMVAAGKLTQKQADKKLESMEGKLFDWDKYKGEDKSQKSNNKEKIMEMVEAGKLTQEQASEKLRAIKEKKEQSK